MSFCFRGGQSCPSVSGAGRHRGVNARETKWTGKSTRDGNGFKLGYSGAPKSIDGVGIILTDRLKDFVVHVERHGDRLMLSGRSEGEKKSFWDSLDELVRSCPDNQRLVLGGDLNGHIGVQSDGYPGVHGGLRFGRRNEEGRMILEFATAHDLIIANSFFRKRKSQLITFQSGRNETQIDYFLVRKGDFRACKDCKVLPKEGCYSQHKLLILDLFLSRRATKIEKVVKPRIL
uniref:craniofacial development protein 2-like n=1 Tax=Erigeron canadensis TaxID=72917 RepID=UPI001CB947D1|nr:craniofacial development protein 2-like [Erigeron canadensis]